MLTLLDTADLLGSADFVVSDDPDPSDLKLDPKLVCPFRVIVDTREQAPFHFLNIDPFSLVFLTTNVALQTGDYSISGMEDRVTVERKSISDLLGSITSGRDRFEREFERMSAMARHPLGGFAAVVIEGELSEVLRYAQDKTRISVDSILGTIQAWTIRYGVPFFLCPGRRFTEIFTLQLLHKFWIKEQRRTQSK